MRNKPLKHDGVFRSKKEWAEIFGISVYTLRKRIREGETLADIAAVPDRRILGNKRKNVRIIPYGDKSYSITEWARYLDMSRYKLCKRLNAGESIADIVENSGKRYKKKRCYADTVEECLNCKYSDCIRKGREM